MTDWPPHEGGLLFFARLPPELLEWRIVAQQLRLELERGRPTILAVATFLLSQGVRCPGVLARFTAADLQPLFESAPSDEVLRTIWDSLRADSSLSAIPDQPLPAHAGFTKDALVKADRAHSSHFQRSGQLAMRTTRKLHLPRHFGKMGPSQRIKVLRPAALSHRILGRYVFDATSVNLPNQV